MLLIEKKNRFNTLCFELESVVFKKTSNFYKWIYGSIILCHSVI